MKVLIWFLACICYGIITTSLKNIGITLGFIPTVILAYALFFVTRKLCERWDMHCLEKKASLEGKSRKEYLIEHTPKFIIDICEGRHTAASIQEMLKPHVKEKLITRAVAKALAEEFGM